MLTRGLVHRVSLVYKNLRCMADFFWKIKKETKIHTMDVIINVKWKLSARSWLSRKIPKTAIMLIKMVCLYYDKDKGVRSVSKRESVRRAHSKFKT